MTTLRATYRLQLGPDFGFAAAASVIPQLAELGISHLYLSPVAEAVAGSSHGYDVTRPDQLRAELGGDDAFAELCSTLDHHAVGLIIDIVPNHLSVADPVANPLWWDVLTRGRASPAAPAFDIDWDDQDDKVILPILEATPDASIEAGVIVARGTGAERRIMVGQSELPVASGTETLELPELLDAQHYRLVRWRRAVRNVRRFFTIDDLVALRMEHEPAARLVNDLPHRLFDAGRIDGVRVDHVDGLADPGGYLRELRAALGGGWIVVEKILAPGEAMPTSWPVDGTTGYDAMRLVDQLLVDPRGEEELMRRWSDISDGRSDFEVVALEARREVLAGELAPDLERCARAARRAMPDPPSWDATVDALTALTVELDRYRTYLPDEPSDRAVVIAMADRAASHCAELAPVIERLRDVLVVTNPDRETAAFIGRWQQLCAPVVAKGDEDRAFYRFHRLSGLCEVGGTPESIGVDLAEFHAEMARRAEHQPRAMVAGTTHDTKRSEDVRARLLVLSEVPDRWSHLFDLVDTELSLLADRTHTLDRYLAVQTAVAAWPISSERLHAFLVKAVREADERSSWTRPDETYEDALGRLAARLVDDARCASLVATVAAEIADAGRSNSLAGCTLRCTIPGVPDIYQGCETWNDGLVDPDNRRPPDFAGLAAQIADAGSADAATAWAEPDSGMIKTVVLRRLLDLRRRRPESFAGASYVPIVVRGAAADRIVAFMRGDDVAVVVSRWNARPRPGLDDVTVDVGRGVWHDVISGRDVDIDGPMPVESVLAGLPVAVLERPTRTTTDAGDAAQRAAERSFR